MSNTHWEFNFNIKKPSPKAVKIFIRGLVLLLFWGTLPCIGYYAGFYKAKKEYNTGSSPVTIKIPSFEMDSEINLGFYNKRAIQFLKKYDLLKKLPKDYKIGTFEAFAIAQVWYGEASTSISDTQNGVLICYWALMNGTSEIPYKAAEQVILFLGDSWPGVHLPSDWEGKYTKQLIKRTKSMAEDEKNGT